MWAYNSTDDTWHAKAHTPTLARTNAVGFSIGDKGYVSCGGYGTVWSAPILYNDMWEYDPIPDAWTQKSSLPSDPRFGCASFVLNGKGYVAAGELLDAIGTNELWEYSPDTDSWLQRASIPGPILGANVKGFEAGGKGYVGTGDALWEYDPLLDLWTPRSPAPISITRNSFAFGIGDKGFIGGGYVGQTIVARNEFYEYSPADDDFTIAVMEEQATSINVWPNPSSDGELWIRSSSLASGERSAELSMIDPSGRCVQNGMILFERIGNASQARISMDQLSNGIYLMMLRTSSGTTTARVSLQR